MNKTLLLVLAFVLLVVGLIYQIYSYQISSQNKIASLDDQAQCDKQAEAFFKNYEGSSDNNFDNYSNHFNIQLGKCFILLNTWSNGSKDILGYHFDMLYDAFENKLYASYNSQTDIKAGETLDSCEMGDKSCNTKTQFDDFVNSYMEN